MPRLWNHISNVLQRKETVIATCHACETISLWSVLQIAAANSVHCIAPALHSTPDRQCRGECRNSTSSCGYKFRHEGFLCKVLIPLVIHHSASGWRFGYLRSLPWSDGFSIEKVGFLHDAEELLLIHLTIAIPASLVNHLLKLLICHAFAKLFGDTLQVLEWDFSNLIVIEHKRNALRITSLGSWFRNLWIIIFKNYSYPMVPLPSSSTSEIIFWISSLLMFKTKGTHGHFQLLGVNGSGAINIKKVKSLFDVMFLLLC